MRGNRRPGDTASGAGQRSRQCGCQRAARRDRRAERERTGSRAGFSGRCGGGQAAVQGSAGGARSAGHQRGRSEPSSPPAPPLPRIGPAVGPMGRRGGAVPAALSRERRGAVRTGGTMLRAAAAQRLRRAVSAGRAGRAPSSALGPRGAHRPRPSRRPGRADPAQWGEGGPGRGAGPSSSCPAAVVEGVSERRAPRAAGVELLRWTPLLLCLLIKFPNGHRVFQKPFLAVTAVRS